jgi:hypothetical protein
MTGDSTCAEAADAIATRASPASVILFFTLVLLVVV